MSLHRDLEAIEALLAEDVVIVEVSTGWLTPQTRTT
jgi:hypothetical protein